MSESISLVHADSVAIIRLARPPSNALTREMLEELATLVDEVTAHARRADRAAPRVLCLESGLLGMFSMGLDPLPLLETDVLGRKLTFVALAELVLAAARLPIPLITTVSGPAIAGGAVLALLGNFVLGARQTAMISFSETKVGLPIPAFVMELINARVVPAQRLEVAFLGKNVAADQALAIGLVNQLYDDDAERAQLMASYVGRITRLPRAVVAATLSAIQQPVASAAQRFLETDVQRYERFLTDEFLGRGLRAIAAGQRPEFP